ncbi:hypothetical protein AB0L00_01605 [Actinoallomurus sp. NPDC052308]|uniref:hypothetical protein n=1 Tax=Actinoallomurus sp. NPDC052308 TaxID=3155530 RepID=UPI003427DA5C
MTTQRPGALMSAHEGLVEAPIDQVRGAVLAVPTGRLRGAEAPLVLGSMDDRYVTVSGGPSTFTAAVAGVPLTIEVDRDAGWVQARGQWWWCGRFQVAEHAEGTLVTQQTFNCATGPVARLVPLTVGRGHRANGRGALLRVLEELADRLHCAARPLSD